VEKPAAANLTCTILTPPSVIRQGQTLQLAAVAKNQNNAVVAGQTFAWSSSNTAVASISPSGLATGGNSTGTTNVTCTVVGGSSTASPPVELRNYANVAADRLRAVVIDDRAGTPITNATVLFQQGASTLGSAVSTDGNGVAEVTLPTPATTTPVSVHVFQNRYTYVSVVGTSTNDLLVPLVPTPDNSKAGGFKGIIDLTSYPTPTSGLILEVGIAGASLPGTFLDLDFNKLIGESIRVQVDLGSIYRGPADIPSGIVAKLGDKTIKGDYAALGEAGLRHAWALGGKIAVTNEVIQLVLQAFTGGGNTTDVIGQVVTQLLPFFDRFRHFVKTEQNVVEVAKVNDTNDINGNGRTDDKVADFNNATAFPTVNAVPAQPLTLSTSITIPTLPQYNGKFLEGALVLAGASVAGRGLVPLGVSAALDAPRQGTTPNGVVDTNPATEVEENTLSFKMAPLHSGLEGSKFFVAVLALSLRLGGGNVPNVSGIVTLADRIDSTTNLSATSFLAFTDAASFNLGTRTFTLSGTQANPVAGANLYRADFNGTDGSWSVFFKAPAAGGSPAFVLPAVPSGASERAVLSAGCSGAPPCTASGGFDELVGFGTTNLRRLNDFVTRFSNAACQENGSCAPPTQ